MKRLVVLLSLLLVFVRHSTALAQNTYDFSQFGRESGDFFSQPGHWAGDDWLTFGLVTSGTLLVMQIDQPIRDAVLRNRGRYYRSVPMEVGRVWGEWYVPPALAGAFGLHGWLAGVPSSRKIAFELVQATVYSEAITQALKITFGRARPQEEEGARSFHPFSAANVGFQSLPGGHTTNGWTISTVLSRNAPSTMLSILAYVPAALTFGSRIYQDKHWASDDFLGAIIGIAVGNWVVDLHEKKEVATSGVLVSPFTIGFRF